MGVDHRVSAHAKLHQCNVVAHELHLTLQWHGHLVGLVHRIAQEVAELGDGFLCGLAVDGCQRGDVVQGVEEEVGVDLILQPCQLSLRVACLLLLQLLAYALDPDEMAQPQCGSNHGEVEQEIDEEPKEHACPGYFRHLRGVVIYTEESPVEQEHQQQVGQCKPPVAAFGEQPAVEDVEISEVDQHGRLQHVERQQGCVCCILPVAGGEPRYKHGQQDENGPYCCLQEE